MRAFLCVLLVVCSLFASAQIALWTRVYATGTSFQFLDVNPSGDIYCFGDKVYSATDTDAMIVKYDHAGTFQWMREEGTSASSNSVGGTASNLGAISGTVEVAHNFRPAGSTVMQSRFNAYSGDAVGPTVHTDAAMTCMEIATWDATTYRVSRRKTSASSWDLVIMVTGGWLNPEEPVLITPLPVNNTVNDMVATADGLYILIGTDGNLTTTNNARLLRVKPDATLWFSAFMGFATHLTFTDYGTDYIFTAGRTGTNGIEVKRVEPSNGGINQTISASAYGANYARIRDLACDTAGNLYLAGSASNNAGAYFRPWKIAFNFAGLTLRWVKDPVFGPTTNAESMRVACDKYGTVSFVDFYQSNASLLFYDSLLGNSLGELTRTGAAVIPYGLRAFANGEVVWCGKGPGFVGGTEAGFVSLASPTGLRDVTRTVASGYGGQVLSAVANFYRPAGANTTVGLSSNSAYALVPASVTVLSGNTSAPANVNIQSTTTERIITLTATQGSAIRKTTFKALPYLLSGLTLDHATIMGGLDAYGTAVLNSTAFMPVNVALGSSIPEARVAVGGVNVVVGRNSALFRIRTSAVTTAKTAVITTSLNGSTRTASLVITHS